MRIEDIAEVLQAEMLSTCFNAYRDIIEVNHKNLELYECDGQVLWEAFAEGVRQGTTLPISKITNNRELFNHIVVYHVERQWDVNIYKIIVP